MKNKHNICRVDAQTSDKRNYIHKIAVQKYRGIHGGCVIKPDSQVPVPLGPHAYHCAWQLHQWYVSNC